jgi:ribose transport system permease protein
MTLLAFAFCGATAAFSGVLLTSRMMTGQVTTGDGYELMAIAGIVIGGASITGGSGTAVGSVFGMLVMMILNNAMTLVSLNAFYQSITQGLILILAMMMDVGRRALRDRIVK